jgi:hypothetical protein
MLSLPEFCTRTILPKADVDALTRLSWRYRGDVYAPDVQPETDVGSMGVTGAPGASLPAPALTAALIALEAPLASDPLNFATVNVYKRSSAGGAVLLATLEFSTGTFNPGVRYALALQGGAPVAYDDQITAEVVKSTSTGMLVPAFTLSLPFSPTFIDARLLVRQGQIYSLLKKRYAVPFADPIPEIALGWQEALVTLDCYRRRGYNPGSAQDAEIKGRADEAWAQIKEAADSKDGLFELPLLESDQSKSAVTAGSPLAYTETSPYVGGQVRANTGTREDGVGRGTGP